MKIGTERLQCPKCGEPARFANIVGAQVQCTLNADGTLGPVLSIAKSTAVIISYECGGGHKFKGAT